MNKNQKTIIGVTGVVLLSCLAMYIVEIYIKPAYFIKSIYAFFLFGILPLIYCGFDKNISLKDYFKLKDKKQLFLSLALGVAVYGFILLAFFLFRPFIDLDLIAQILDANVSVNRDNFIYVALYISFVNSLLEEFFFRGFAFLSLKKTASKAFSYLASAAAFSLYHIAILTNWFNAPLFILVLVGLFIAGLIFNCLNEKSGNIYNSWLVHMFANFAINTIGLSMFSII